MIAWGLGPLASPRAQAWTAQGNGGSQAQGFAPVAMQTDLTQEPTRVDGQFGNTRILLGRFVLYIWHGQSYMDGDGDGKECCSIYIPLDTPGYPDGALLVGRHHLCDAPDRDAAIKIGLELMRSEIARFESQERPS